MDDFNAIITFMVKYTESIGLNEKIFLLQMQEYPSEHKLLFTRIIVLLSYYITGKINFPLLIIIGNMLLIGIGICLFTISRQDKKTIAIFLIAMLLFNGQNFDSSIWTLAVLANIGTLFLLYLSAYLLLSGSKKNFIVGILLSIISIFSSGSGMFMVPVILLCLLLQKQKKKIYLYGLTCGLFICLYFMDYQSSPRMNRDYMQIVNILPYLFENLFVFIGNNFWIPSKPIISIFVGLGCFSIYIFGIIRHWYKKDIFCFACLSFLYICAAATAISRWDETGTVGLLRYRIYGSLFLSLSLLLVVNNIKDKYFKYIQWFVPAIALFSLFSTIIYQAKSHKILEWKMVSAYNWANGIDRLADPTSHSESITFFKRAEQIGLYKMPHYTLSKYKIDIEEDNNFNVEKNSNIEYSIEEIKEKENYLIIKGFAYLTDLSMNQSDIYLYLIDSEHQFKCIPFFERRYDINYGDNSINVLKKVECGFLAVIDKKDIPNNAKYKIGIEIKRVLDRNKYQILTNQEIKL